MTDKVQKIREEIERLKSQLIKGACASQIAMETRCKEEAYNEVLAILDSLQEEPVDEGLEEAAKHYLYSNILYDDVYVGNPTDKDCIQMFKAGANWQKEQMMKDAIDATVESDLDGHGADYGIQKLNCEFMQLESKKIKSGKRVKIVIIK